MPNINHILKIIDYKIIKAISLLSLIWAFPSQYALTKLGSNRKLPQNKQEFAVHLWATANTDKMAKGTSGKILAEKLNFSAIVAMFTKQIDAKKNVRIPKNIIPSTIIQSM